MTARSPSLPDVRYVVATGMLVAGCAGGFSAMRAGVPTLSPTGGTARMFAEGSISTGDASCLAFTPDGRSLFFMRESPRYTIMHSRYGSDAWTTPAIAAVSGTHNDIDPFVTTDGSLLLFGSRRPLTGAQGELTVYQLWAAPLESGRVGTPVPFGPPPDLTLSRFGTMDRDGTLYFTQRLLGTTVGNDVYRSRRVAGVYQPPERLPDINSEYSDSNPFIAPDGSFLVFFSARPGGFGNSDLYVSFPEGERWTTPRNLGPGVNTADSENCPTLSPDGQYLLFSRGRRRADGQIESRNIYYVDAAVLRR